MELSDVTSEATDFGEIAAEFRARVERMVWCNVASVDAEGRPRSRIMHPIWEDQVGWIGTWLTSNKANHEKESLKITHLRRNPHVSLAYVSEVMNPVYVDCQVEILDTVEAKRKFAELATSFPEPYGYDPAQIFGEPDDPSVAVLRLTPTRIALVEFPAPPGRVVIWRR
jgi:general stress protein 26